MTHKFSRAQRRADRVRLKEKRQYHWGYGHKNDWGRDAERGEICYMPPKVAGSVIETPTPCSCEMCRNERHSAFADNPLTMQERRQLDSFKDGLEEYYIGFDDWDWWYATDDYDDFYWSRDYEEYINWKWAKARGWSS